MINIDLNSQTEIT